MTTKILKRRAGAFGALPKTIFCAVILAGGVAWVAFPLNAAERRWTGNAGGLWSNPNNWSPAGTPQPGEQLTFNFGEGSMFNDLVGVMVERLWFEGDLQWSSAYPQYRLQSVNSLDGPGPFGFSDVFTPPVLVEGKFAVTNAISTPRQFFRLEAR